MANEWVETEPTGPEPAGDPGGDVQDGPSWSRRWVMPTPGPGGPGADGYSSVMTFTFYPARLGGRRWVEREVERIVCTDPQRPGDTEIWAEYDYSEVGKSTGDGAAEELCAAASPDDFPWDGRDGAPL